MVIFLPSIAVADAELKDVVASIFLTYSMIKISRRALKGIAKLILAQSRFLARSMTSPSTSQETIRQEHRAQLQISLLVASNNNNDIASGVNTPHGSAGTNANIAPA